MTQEGRNSILLPLNTPSGWDEDLKKQVENLISKLTPTEVISELKKLTREKPPSKKYAGRPKSYKTAWIQLENNSISFDKFQTLVHQQLVDKKITNHTYYRAIRKAKQFLAHKKNITTDPTSYEEAWIAFSANQIQMEKFEEVLNQLLANNKITQAKYEHGLNEAKKYKKLLAISKKYQKTGHIIF